MLVKSPVFVGNCMEPVFEQLSLSEHGSDQSWMSDPGCHRHALDDEFSASVTDIQWMIAIFIGYRLRTLVYVFLSLRFSTCHKSSIQKRVVVESCCLHTFSAQVLQLLAWPWKAQYFDQLFEKKTWYNLCTSS